MKKSLNLIELCKAMLALFCLLSMYVFPGIVKSSTSNALILCGRSVIPSLFPYIILTRTVLYFLMKFKSSLPPTALRTGISISSYIALASGLLAGAPTGAILAGQMYSHGLIKKDEAEKTAVFSSVASPAFCINFFGAGIVGKRTIGLILYLASVTVNLLLLAVSEIFFNNPKEEAPNTHIFATEANNSVGEIISGSCITMLGICANITFFMCAGEVLYTVISFFFGESILFKVFFIGAAEMTSGVSITRMLPLAKRILCSSAIIGFGGLSVMMQTASVCAEYHLNCSRLFAIKFVSAFTVPTIVFAFTVISKDSFSSVASSVILTIVAFVFTFLTHFVRKMPKKYKKSKVNL